MSRILLIRHAQASYGAEDYDQLSPRGHEQAKQLATWLVQHEEALHLGAVVCGAMRRHAQTLSMIDAAFAAAGRALPATAIDADWNEFDHDSVVRAYAQTFPDDPKIAAARDSHAPREVKALLMAALQSWSRAELDDRAAETWSAFGNRVARARAQLPTHVRSGGTTLVMSSGGVIARCAQAALGIDDVHTVDMNLSLRNTGISEFHSSAHGWHLHTWNGLPHFSAPGAREWMTYY
ncbi:hypothetical protein ELE36_16070 [Pseudolysobacter antarcticus]|uniref:Histidine phosphatase family protein n=1 Tax=Pseudolysobacter antarcticus TaxID=2511995 RepID=A0A411HMN8_9GAMM|nr:histidine phosphatase family protein [Pseudolysobacter antarcticus]QBB71747.1 hypothetical protein ELE36_16070 [Pseudolysobacter antarcticus]